MSFTEEQLPVLEHKAEFLLVIISTHSAVLDCFGIEEWFLEYLFTFGTIGFGLLNWFIEKFRGGLVGEKYLCGLVLLYGLRGGSILSFVS